MYVPELGRFLQVDPVEGGTLNSYVYAMDPVNQRDLSGKWSIGNLLRPVQSLLYTTAGRVLTRNGTKPNALGGYLSWLGGSGSSMKFNAGTIKWRLDNKSIKGLSFPTPLKSGKIKAKFSVSAYADGDAKEHIGGVSGQFTGTVEKSLSGKYTARGLFRPNANIYDFDVHYDGRMFSKSTWQREWATLAGGYGGALSGTSQDYNISFEGSAYVEFSW